MKCGRDTPGVLRREAVVDVLVKILGGRGSLVQRLPIVGEVGKRIDIKGGTDAGVGRIVGLGHRKVWITGGHLGGNDLQYGSTGERELW